MSGPHLKRALRTACAAVGVNALCRRATHSLPRVIMYHGFCRDNDGSGRIPADQLDRHLAHIRRRFRPMRLTDMVRERMATGAWPKRAVALTVDDGYADFFELALPLLVRHQVPATVFVVSAMVEQNGWIWPDKLTHLAHAAGDPAFSPGSEAFRDELDQLKRKDAEARDARLEELAGRYGVAFPASPPGAFALMGWDQLAQARATGLVEIGSHTRTHPILAHLDSEAGQHEIAGARQEIAARLGAEPTSFCYPNGLSGDYRPDQRDHVRDAGYLCGVASHFGYVRPNEDRFALPRIWPHAGDHNLFLKHLDGLEFVQARLRG